MYKFKIEIFLKSKTNTIEHVLSLSKIDDIRPFVDKINKNGVFVCVDNSNLPKVKLSYIKDLHVARTQGIAWISPNHIAQIIFELVGES